MLVLSCNTILNAQSPGIGSCSPHNPGKICVQGSRRNVLARSWRAQKLGATGLPIAVEAILLDEAFAADESVATDPVVSFSNDYSIYLFTAVVITGVLFIAGVIYSAVTDFSDKQQAEELNKQAERREKRLAAKASKKKSKVETMSSRPSPKGFGQSKDEELVE